jgi:hypothetical protein
MPYHHHHYRNPQPNYYDYHDYVKCKSAVTNLLTHLDEISPLVTSHPQLDTVCFDCSTGFAFDSRFFLKKENLALLPSTTVSPASFPSA